MVSKSDSAFEQHLRDAKLAALAEFAAGAGHEINNPLATISGYAQLLLKDETDDSRRHALLAIGGQALRIRDMIGDLMIFARPPVPQYEQLDLSTLVRDTASRMSQEAQSKECWIDVSAGLGITAEADPDQVRTVISSLLRNALDLLPKGGGVSVTVEAAEEIDAEGQARPGVQILVSDTGPGLAPGELEHAFDPFFSGRSAGRGLGFGLSKCWRILTQHGGRIELSNRPEGGLNVRTWWPATQSPTQS